MHVCDVLESWHTAEEGSKIIGVKAQGWLWRVNEHLVPKMPTMGTSRLWRSSHSRKRCHESVYFKHSASDGVCQLPGESGSWHGGAIFFPARYLGGDKVVRGTTGKISSRAFRKNNVSLSTPPRLWRYWAGTICRTYGPRPQFSMQRLVLLLGFSL